MKSDRKRQVTTTRLKYGKEHYKNIGSVGGKNSPTHFDSESGKKASARRWEKYRQEQKEIANNNVK